MLHFTVFSEERAGARAGSVSPGLTRSINTIRTPRPSPTRRPSRAPCAPTRARPRSQNAHSGPYEPRFSRERDGRGGASPLRVWRATSARTGPSATQPVCPAAPPFTGCGPRRGGHLSAEHKETRHCFKLFYFFISDSGFKFNYFLILAGVPTLSTLGPSTSRSGQPVTRQ
jgi:hypothetical protein